ncbi:MAG: hypothetical protein V1866_03235 [archaeon]
MQITVDTEKDSPENIKKVIELLQRFVDKTDIPSGSVFSPDMEIFSSAAAETKKEEEPAVEKKDIFGNFLHRKSSKKKKDDDDDDDGSIGIKIIPY